MAEKKKYIPKHFQPQELVDLKTYNLYKNDSYGLFSEELLKLIDIIRESFGLTMIVNTWSLSTPSKTLYGDFSYRGYRPIGCGVGDTTGAHYKGLAVDFDLWSGTKKLESDYIANILIEKKELYPGLKGIEVNVGWNHIDCMERNGQPKDKICVFDTKGLVSWA